MNNPSNELGEVLINISNLMLSHVSTKPGSNTSFSELTIALYKMGKSLKDGLIKVTIEDGMLTLIENNEQDHTINRINCIYSTLNK